MEHDLVPTSPQEWPEIPAEALADQTKLLETLQLRLSRFSATQVAYLCHLPLVGKPEARKKAGVSESTISFWRHNVEGFREAERGVELAVRGARQALARAIADSAAPEIVRQLVEDATGPAETDRQLTARHRARERVLDIAGVTASAGAADGAVERVDLIAARIFYAKKARETE